MEPSLMIKVYPNRYDMRVLERKVFMYYMVQSSVKNFSTMIDVRQRMLNLSNLVEQGIITSTTKTELEAKARKYEINIYKRHVFISIELLLQYIIQKKYNQAVIRAVETIQQDLLHRTKVLALEKQKRNKQYQKQFNIQINDRQESVKYLKSKLKYLFEREYQINSDEPLQRLYDRVKSGSVLKSEGLKMSHYQEQKMKSIYNRYFKYFSKISQFEGASAPTVFTLPRQLTSLYIVHTDLQATFEGKTYNVVKVGKTDKCIYDYQSCLYQDYKSKILFKHVFLGIFQKEANAPDIDKYFHQKLIVIPKSKYFIFNFHQTEQDTRVSQQFYLLTDQFMQKMEMLLKQFCKTHRHVKDVSPYINR